MNGEELRSCLKRIESYIHNTPVLTSVLLNKISGAKLYFKCENFQKTGAFKMRGAANAVLQLTEDEKLRGVVTHSSGNFAQALSLAAGRLGVKAYIVMPSDAPIVKKEAVRGYGGEIIESEPTLKSRAAAVDQIIKQHGAIFIHPSNNPDVILGQGTACLELLDKHPDLEFILVPVGGGGLIAGSALAAHFFGNDCKTNGGEPFEVDDAYRSILSGRIESNRTTNTIADGLKTQLGEVNFPIIKKYVDQIIRVEEEEIVRAMKMIWERMKIVVEASSAVAFAALLREKDRFKDKKVGVILSGGNVDLNNLPF
jgi:threonine dehydratase